MKPRLVHNWPHVKEENDELSSRILDLAHDFSEELKEKNKNNVNNEEKKTHTKTISDNNLINVTELKPIISDEENLG